VLTMRSSEDVSRRGSEAAAGMEQLRGVPDYESNPGSSGSPGCQLAAT